MVRPTLGVNSFNQLKRVTSLGIQRPSKNPGFCKPDSFQDNSNVFFKREDSYKQSVNAKKIGTFEECFSIKDNFSFRKSKQAPFLEQSTTPNIFDCKKERVKKAEIPKTKRIQKNKKFISDELYTIVKQLLKEVRSKQKQKKLKILNQTNVLYNPNFYYHYKVATEDKKSDQIICEGKE
jgi:hypothetical protein